MLNRHPSRSRRASRFARPLLVLAGAFGATSVAARAEDWPQWLGPQRDAEWRETGIVDKFPSGGPKVLWRTPIHGGYSGPAVADGRVFVTDYDRKEGDPADGPGIRNVLKGTERLLCLDAKSGEKRWEYAYPCEYHISYPMGPRSTPTVDGDRVYMLGAEGRLACLNVADGKPMWEMDLNDKFQCDTPYWGFSSHPLIDGERLVLVAGGEGSVVVALNKMTGETIWKALSAREAGYGSPVIFEAGGTRQLLVWHPEAVNSLNPETGALHWSVPLMPEHRMSINIPVRAGKHVYVAGIEDKGVMLELAADAPKAKELWRADGDIGVGPVHSPMLMSEDTLYAIDGSGQLTACDVATGKHLWKTTDATTHGKKADSATGFMVRNGERTFIVSEIGDLIIAKLTREAYEEIDRAKIIEPTHPAWGRVVHWSCPAYANRCIFVRNDKEILCASLAAEGAAK